ncbi:hypothetical protein chiPu_0024454 [Chiloscyllium punctatum]|uniref:Uncharacterized protein n=1 Tax=Chiloscyllium punctatum TaxID=137246 RepID=A0A401TCE1_CHIPU|nr:hypothetical protein [Chiloscyllium punctatum]
MAQASPSQAGATLEPSPPQFGDWQAASRNTSLLRSLRPPTPTQTRRRKWNSRANVFSDCKPILGGPGDLQLPPPAPRPTSSFLLSPRSPLGGWDPGLGTSPGSDPRPLGIVNL